MQTIRFLTYRVGSNPKDIDVICERDIIRQGRDPEELATALGDRAAWFSIQVKDASALLEEEVTGKTLIGDPLSGFRSNPLLLPRARVATLLEGWSHTEAPSMKSAGDIHPNLLASIDQALQKHLRPSILEDPDFLSAWSASGKPSGAGSANS